MRRLFASAFTTPFNEVDADIEHRYDECRSLNLDPDGRPVVAIEAAMRTGTVTEVRAETADRDREEGRVVAAVLGTVTKGRGEPPDRRAGMGTQTRVAAEPPDRGEAAGLARALLVTKSAAPGEPADRPRGGWQYLVHCPERANPRLVTR